MSDPMATYATTFPCQGFYKNHRGFIVELRKECEETAVEFISEIPSRFFDSYQCDVIESQQELGDEYSITKRNLLVLCTGSPKSDSPVLRSWMWNNLVALFKTRAAINKAMGW